VYKRQVFGNSEADLRDASPTTYVHNLRTPMLMFSDRQTYKYATIFENLLRNQTNYTDFSVIHVHQKSHGELWRALADSSSIHSALIIDFIRNH